MVSSPSPSLLKRIDQKLLQFKNKQHLHLLNIAVNINWLAFVTTLAALPAKPRWW
jgi:hypothetical protein